MPQKIVVLTGAGMSADSGLATFRDSGGLWEGYDVYEVATPEGWNSDPEKVLEFYNKRRKQAAQAEPNKGHLALARLEEKFDTTIITQNVDDLHERAGSSDVIHLHGQLSKVRSEKNENLIFDIGDKEIYIGDKADDGAQLRPHVVWFGEMVPKIEKAAEIIPESDIFIVIGTSLVVYPAAGLVDFAPENAEKYIVDPSTPEIQTGDDWQHYKERASEGVPKVVDKLLNEYKQS